MAELDITGASVARYAYGSRPNVPDLVIKGGLSASLRRHDMTCYQILSIARPFGIAGAVAQVACVIAIVWAARTIPNTVRTRNGIRGLLLAMLPGVAWKAAFEEEEVRVLELARRRFYVIFVALAFCAAARIGVALLVRSCL